MIDSMLRMSNITKEFSGVKALDCVNIEVKEGHVHALVGENGAGKSTLMKVLSGIYVSGDYKGEVYFKGKKCAFRSIKESEQAGIAIIHQELALSPYLSVMENIYLGNEISKRGIVSWDKTRELAKKYMGRVGLKIDENLLIKDIGVGQQQLVEIAKALAKDCELLILDEPTAALNDKDSDKLLELLLDLKDRQGLTSIIISHKLNEVTKVADEITIIRDGATIETLVKGKDNISEERIIKGMVGRDLVERFPKRTKNIGDTVFEVKKWRVHDPLNEEHVKIKDVNFHLKKGEVVGIAGLMGAGRTELAMSIFGKSYGKNISGEIKKNGKTVELKSVAEAIRHGVAYLTEDRKEAGLILSKDIRENISLANLSGISRRGVVDVHGEIAVAEEYKEKLNIKCSSVYQKVGDLSGGNQQKVALAKWLFSQPDILILDEPTRGIDVGAKYEIYNIINQLAALGRSIIVISSELPEILGICDRVYVMNEGAIVGELPVEAATQEKIMTCIMQNTNQLSTEGVIG